MNFKLQPKGDISNRLIEMGFEDFEGVTDWVRNLPYERISDKKNIGLTITENRGTCGSKHAFLKTIAEEQEQYQITLFIGVFKMSPANTQGISSILTQHNLQYIPEAHCYLKFEGKRYDFTSPTLELEKIEAVLMEELEVQPNQIAGFKTRYHRHFIQKWLDKEGMNKTLNKIWEAREACIQRLSNIF